MRVRQSRLGEPTNSCAFREADFESRVAENVVATRLSQPLQHYGDENKIVRVEDIAGMEELRKLGPKRNLAEELY